jgi:hypothetical protein
VLVAAALGDGGDAGVALNLGGALITLALFTEGGEQSRGKGCTGTRQRSKQGIVGQGLADAGDLGIEALEGPQPRAQLFDEGEHQELVGLDHGWVVVIRGRSPAFTGSYLPAVSNITECRTDQL